jgi:Uma2 family endonuclease
MELYARHGVREYWIADPEAKTIDQFLNENGQFIRIRAIKPREALASQIIEAFSFRLPGFYGVISHRIE